MWDSGTAYSRETDESKLDDENKSDVDAELELKKMEEDRMTKIKAVDELSTKEIEQNLVASKSLLRMSALILKMSYNKDIYSSTEHLLMFLQAYDNELVGLAMNALAQLALPPPQHRYHEEFNRHNTPLHKVAMHSLALFDIVDAAFKTIGSCLWSICSGSVQSRVKMPPWWLTWEVRAIGVEKSCLARVAVAVAVARKRRACSQPSTITEGK